MPPPDLFTDNTISVEEYREKKAQLLNQKVELEKNPMTQDGKWLEQMKNFVTLAHQASCIAAEANYEALRDYFKIFGSNLRLANAILLFSYRYPYKFFAERPNNNMGFLSNVMRGNLSEFTRSIIYIIPYYIKNILDLER